MYENISIQFGFPLSRTVVLCENILYSLHLGVTNPVHYYIFFFCYVSKKINKNSTTIKNKMKQHQKKRHSTHRK